MVYMLVLYILTQNDSISRICHYFMSFPAFETILKNANHKVHPKSTRNSQKILVYDELDLAFSFYRKILCKKYITREFRQIFQFTINMQPYFEKSILLSGVILYQTKNKNVFYKLVFVNCTQEHSFKFNCFMKKV